MFDWSAWINRARQFTNALKRLPGEIDIEVEVAPPLAEREALKLAAGLSRGLPQSLHELFVYGSASCTCRYVWTPPESLAPKLKQVLPGYFGPGDESPFLKEMLGNGDLIYGGAALGSVWEFGNYQTYALDLAEAFDAYTDGSCAKDAELWRRCMPFAPIRNGDFLGLDISHDESCPVVYLSHEGGGMSRIISPSLEQFATDWETLCYIGPEIWLLEEWIDESTGYLTPDSLRAKLLRTLLTSSGI